MVRIQNFICGGPSFHLELYEKQKTSIQIDQKKKIINFQFLIVVSEMHFLFL